MQTHRCEDYLLVTMAQQIVLSSLSIDIPIIQHLTRLIQKVIGSKANTIKLVNTHER